MQARPTLIAEPEFQRPSSVSARTTDTFSASPIHHSLMACLQSTIGNRAVQRLVGSGILQPKLTVGSPDDVYEKEADEVAEQVTSSKAHGLLGKCAQPGSTGSDEDCSEYDGLGKSARMQRTVNRNLVARIPLSTLHRWIGNRAIAQMLRSETISSPSTASTSELRRKCSCGGDSEGECKECRTKRLAVQRLSSTADAGLEAPPVVEEVLATAGQPLADSVRRSLEPGFGYDFSQVRIHDHSKAAESARSVNALAYTVGNHIVFGDGQYDPGTSSGDRLLAHELTHTIQQTGGTPGGLQRQPSDDEAEVLQGGAIAGAAGAVNQAVGPTGPAPVPIAPSAGPTGPSPVPMAGPTGPTGPAPAPPAKAPAAAGCKASPAVPFTANKAVLHGPVAGSTALSGCKWGLTFPEAVRATISAHCDGTDWFAVLTGLTGDFSQQVRLLPSEHEVTAGNSTKANFCDQATELHDLGHCSGAWYKLAAVKAHEDVHLTRFKPALVAQAPTIEATITALSVPDAPGKTAAKAAQEIAALPAFAAALATAQTTWLHDILTRVANDHDAGGPCETAEHGVVDPVVNSICGKAKANKWGDCGVCP